MTHPYAAYTASRDKQAFLSQFITNPLLTESRILKGNSYDGFFHFGINTVLEYGFTAGDFLKSGFAACVVQLFDAVKAVAGIAKQFAGLGNITQLFCQLQQPNLRFD